MLLEIKNRVLLGLLFFVLGICMLFIRINNPLPARAAQSFSTVWEAKQFINVTAKGEGGPTLGPISIGISRWENVTTQSGRVVYRETWNAVVPSSNEDIYFSAQREGDPDAPPVINLPNGYNESTFKSAWLYGVGKLNLGNNASHRVIFSFSDTPATEKTLGATGRQPFKSIGNSLDCKRDSGNADCLAATGSYGFGIFELMGDGINGYPSGFGLLMPRKWIVDGTIF